MSWGAVAGAVIGGAISYMGEKKKQKAAEKAAKAASGPTTETTTRTPWGPSEEYRKGIMGAAYNQAMGLGGAGGGGRRRRGGRGGGGGGGGGGLQGIGIQSYIKDVLSGKYLEANPHLETAVIDPIRQEGLRTEGRIDLAGEASGFTRGASGMQLERARNQGETYRAMEQARYQDYNDRMADIMTAMGYGTEYDIAVMNNQTARRGQNLSHRASMAGINLEREKWAMQKLGMAGDIINAMSGAYGTSTTVMQGPQKTAAYHDPLLAGFQGGVAGAQMGNDLQQAFGGGGGGGTPWVQAGPDVKWRQR